MLRTHLISSVRFFTPDKGPGAPASGAPAAAPVAGGGEPKLSLGEQFRAAIAAKGSLQKQIDTLRAEAAEAGETIARLTGENAALTTERDDLASSVTALTTERDNLSGEVSRLKSEAKSAEDRASEIVASKGFKAEDLPKPDANADAPKDGSIEALQAEFAAETDADKRGELAARIAKMAREAK